MEYKEQQVHNSVEVSFYQNNLDCTLDGKLTSNGWNFSMWHKEKKEFLFERLTLQQFMEIILLGKMVKDKLIQTSEEKVAPITASRVELSKGLEVTVYNDPITETKEEGKAVLIEMKDVDHFVVPPQELWLVEFLDDKQKVCRWIKSPVWEELIQASEEKIKSTVEPIDMIEEPGIIR